MKTSVDVGSELQNKFIEECERLEIALTLHYLIVSIFAQELYHYCDGRLVRTYTVSTSEKPCSCVQDSFGTPWGMHKIVEKIGEGVELGMVFKQRKPVGQRYWEYGEEHLGDKRLVTTRILWLRGLELGLNKGEGIDSYDRYIYIHGTNREHLLGSPATLGCVTLSNEDIITLYDAIPSESLVWIKQL